MVGELVVEPRRGAVSGACGEFHLEPKVMALLVRLAQSPLHVLSRQDLLDSVWARVEVSDQVLTRAISTLRRVLDQGDGRHSLIQTVSKQGYRLTVPVRPAATATATTTARPTAAAATRLPEGDAVAVLPLQLMETAADRAFLGLGMARDLTHLLSQIPGLRMIASVSAERAAAEQADAVRAATDLGARYLVTGSLESRATTVRVRVALSDVRSHEQIWSGRYDAMVAELFQVQDELVLQIGRSLSSALALGHVQRIESKAVFDLTAYESMQLAESARRRYSREASEFIVLKLTAALELQPENGVAHALLAMQLSQNLVSRWADDGAATAAAAAYHLDRAMQLAGNDSRVLMAAGVAALMRGDHAHALALLQDSLAANPNEAHTLAELGTARYFVTRELAPSIAMIEAAESAAPDHPRFGIWAYRRGICSYEAGEIAAAIAAYEQAIARMPAYYHVHFTKAVALAAAGHLAAARASIRRGQALAPGASYQDYEVGVLAFGLTVPGAVRVQLRSL
jgi:DNA-binding winged helix-turn-helix (wHTH) protein/tetratricopeptide (TPR) repeat protein